MIQRFRIFAVGLAAAVVLATGIIPRPVDANTSSTITIVAGAAAIVGGIILYNNYQHRQQAASQIVGYTRNGGSILGNGRIVMPDGQTFFPGANGQYSWGQYAYYDSRFNGSTVAYDQNRSGGFDRTHHHDNGLHRGWYKDRNGDDHNRGNQDHEDRGHGHGHD